MNEKGITIPEQQQPGTVSFANFEELKALLSGEMADYGTTAYGSEVLPVAKADLKILKAFKKQITDKKKESKEAYSAPYRELQAKPGGFAPRIPESPAFRNSKWESLQVREYV